jgi:hypothetical protein
VDKGHPQEPSITFVSSSENIVAAVEVEQWAEGSKVEQNT